MGSGDHRWSEKQSLGFHDFFFFFKLVHCRFLVLSILTGHLSWIELNQSSITESSAYKQCQLNQMAVIIIHVVCE